MDEKGLTKENLVELIRNLYQKIDGQKAELSKLDTEIGDGDHGFSLAKGFKSLVDKLPEYSKLDTGEMLKKCGFELIKTVGGAAGAVFGTFFTGQAVYYVSHLKDRETLSLSDFTGMLSEALTQVKKRGGAQPGDKTMIDALEPAVEALTAAVESGAGFAEAFGSAAEAAEAGAEKTRNMVAKKGRSKNVGERGLGYKDPGAASMALIFKTMAEYFQSIGI